MDYDQVLRSSGEALLSVPPTSQAHTVGMWYRAFSVVAPRLQSSLPGKISRLAPSVLSFRFFVPTGFGKPAAFNERLGAVLFIFYSTHHNYCHQKIGYRTMIKSMNRKVSDSRLRSILNLLDGFRLCLA